VFPILVQMNESIAANYSDLCPDCAIGEENMDLRTMSQELAGQTQNLLRTDGDITHLIATFDSAAIFMDQGVTQLGSEVKIVGANGNPANLDLMRAGGSQIADAAYPPASYVAWQLVDQIGRLLAGEDASHQTLGVQLIDESNLAEDNSLESQFPELAGFEATFLEAWGLG
jgi:ABC-type sugar transport system substrate-binding protein